MGNSLLISVQYFKMFVILPSISHVETGPTDGKESIPFDKTESKESRAKITYCSSTAIKCYRDNTDQRFID